MGLPRGTRIGVHEVISLLGQGGMGEVYRARDTTLQRDVALKVLPDSFAADRERVARFQREAQILASLNHPHIAQIHSLVEHRESPSPDSRIIRALVMELIDGPTLADRLKQGPLPFDEARLVARQIALALEAAHDQDIVHRDLKPANIKIRAGRGFASAASGVGRDHDQSRPDAGDTSVKVLDFGLAKAITPPTDEAILSNSPTITSPAMTRQGIVLGTAAYMAPEQARGRPVDKRVDIWAFGCVLYEMLTGKPAFDGEDAAAVLGAVVRLEPDWRAVPADVPPSMVWVLERCLQKDPRLRLRDIADARALIDEGPALKAATPASSRSTRFGTAGWVAAALAMMVAGAVAIWPRAPAVLPETRVQIVALTPELTSLAVSPDGRSLVYLGDDRRLWLRRLESEEAVPLEGTDLKIENGASPVWSPDGRSIAFFASGQLKRIDLDSHFVRTLAPASIGRRVAWSPSGVILFGSNVGPLRRISADGTGQITDVTTLAAGQTNHRMPQFLPDGRHFLFLALGLPESRGLYLGSLDDQTARRVADRPDAFAFVAPSHVLAVKDGALWAHRLNLDSMTIVGEPSPVAPRVFAYADFPGYAAFSASPAGTLAYRPTQGTNQLLWLDRRGATIGTLGSPEEQDLESIAPDGRSVAVSRPANGNLNVWLLDTERGVSRRITSDPMGGGRGIFSPDGRRIAYVSDARADVYDIYIRATDGTGTETLAVKTGENIFPRDWSRDGRYLSYMSQSPEGNLDLSAVALEDRRTPIPIAQTRNVESGGRFSPDGRWITVESNDNGPTEVYLQQFPVPGPKFQVSLGGGSSARWRADGRELTYRSPDNRVMAVPLTLGPTTPTIGTPSALFTLPQGTGSFEMTPDGQRFLVNSQASRASPITLILNWKPPAR